MGFFSSIGNVFGKAASGIGKVGKSIGSAVVHGGKAVGKGAKKLGEAVVTTTKKLPQATLDVIDYGAKVTDKITKAQGKAMQNLIAGASKGLSEGFGLGGLGLLAFGTVAAFMLMK